MALVPLILLATDHVRKLQLGLSTRWHSATSLLYLLTRSCIHSNDYHFSRGTLQEWVGSNIMQWAHFNYGLKQFMGFQYEGFNFKNDAKLCLRHLASVWVSWIIKFQRLWKAPDTFICHIARSHSYYRCEKAERYTPFRQLLSEKNAIN